MSAHSTPICAAPGSVRIDRNAFLLIHALAIPAAWAAAALGARAIGLDDGLTSLFFNSADLVFPVRAWPLLELFGHKLAKAALWAVWLIVLTAALAAPHVPRLAALRTVLWTTVAAMAIGPILVVVLKDINATRCPWDLKAFGGSADFASGWFVAKSEAGRCFPSGHAAGGFSLVAIYFAGLAAGHRRAGLAALAATLIVGGAFSLLRIAQGAHFLSHNLWSAAVVWCAAALVFARLFDPVEAPRNRLLATGATERR